MSILSEISSLLQGFSVFGIAVTLFIHNRQRADSRESEKQANRSRVTEAYMRWHAEILSNDKNIEIVSKMFRKSYRVLGSKDGKIYDEQTRQIEILYMFLNAIFLEYNYRIAYKLPISEFFKTVDAALIGIATNTDPEYRRLVDNFSNIFSDFPDDFKSVIEASLIRLRKAEPQAALPTAN